MRVHAAPNDHPGGVQGALFRSRYQSEDAPLPIDNPPMVRAAKFSKRNAMILKAIGY
tara:strand:+ start:404 stop:574 length:171 start_codon:yes stop_codon:yes gene_type:complete